MNGTYIHMRERKPDSELWAVQIQCEQRWVTVQRLINCKEDAEWWIAKWRQLWKCEGDPFRVVPQLEAEKTNVV